MIPIVIDCELETLNDVIECEFETEIHVDGNVTVKRLEATENGTYQEEGVAYSPVIVDVEGLVPTGTLNITENGVYDVTEKASVDVNVEGLIPTGTLEITENGTYDVTTKANANVSVKQWDTELSSILDGSATELSGLPSGLSKIKPYAFYQKTRQLPSIYQRVEYIESKGNACINTGITAKPPFKSTIDGMWGTYTSGSPTMLGTEEQTGGYAQGKYNVMFGRGPNWFYIQNGTGGGTTYLYSTHATDSNRHTFETEVSSTTSTIRVDDTVDSINYTHAQLTSNPMFLFARGNKTSSVTTSGTQFRLYSFELINDGELVWSAIPCYRKIDGAIGLYNAVDNRFYENIGTEAFIKGENININGEICVPQQRTVKPYTSSKSSSDTWRGRIRGYAYSRRNRNGICTK